MELRRYFIQLAFKGTNYHGWQRQKNQNSVQQTLEKALSIALRRKTLTVGAGRTDTGVHASFFVAHFDAPDNINTSKLIENLNGLTPNDIVIYKIFQTPTKAHARFDAISRTYKYFIHTVPNPFINDISLFVHHKLDVYKMQLAAEKLLLFSDFKTFSKAHSGTKHYLCKIYNVNLKTINDKIIFSIKANRFLRGMVRAIVGTLLMVGKGKLSVDQFQNIIQSRQRNLSGPLAPPHGLFLYDIEYPENLNNLLIKNHKLFWNENL